MADGGERTRFFELQGPGALARLRRLGDALASGGTRVTLLASRDQAGLYLLVAEGGPEPLPSAALTEGCTVWTFERLAA